MTKRFWFVLMAGVCAVGLHAESSLDSMLNRLDEVVANRGTYIHNKEQDLLRLKDIYRISKGHTQHELCLQIAELYDGFNTDSTLYYATEAERIGMTLGDVSGTQQARIYIARCLAINGMYERADEILTPMEPLLQEANRALYYKTCSSMYIWKAEFTTIQEEKQAGWDHIPALRDSVLKYETDPIWLKHERALQVNYDYPQGAVELLRPLIDSLPKGDTYVRYLANTLGSSYTAMQITDSALYYYALSAISDMEHGVMEHASLREVALLLYRSGNTADIERAYRYMNCCIEDADFCKARLRTIEMAQDMPVILEAYRTAMNNQQARMRTLNIILAISTIVVLLALIFALISYRWTRKARLRAESAREELRCANEQLQTALLELQSTNASLEESNRIRQAYVTQYMHECSESGIRLEEYHQSLLHVALHSDYKALMEAVKSRVIIEETRKIFTNHFDETFLSLFPNFVEQLNSLLREDAQYPIPQQKKLNTELRIYALIRLGITDSEEIARFLRHSTKTVFNYRAAVRGRAKGNRDELEQMLMQIG